MHKSEHGGDGISRFRDTSTRSVGQKEVENELSIERPDSRCEESELLRRRGKHQNWYRSLD
jgi:hypothetical protein